MVSTCRAYPYAPLTTSSSNGSSNSGSSVEHVHVQGSQKSQSRYEIAMSYAAGSYQCNIVAAPLQNSGARSSRSTVIVLIDRAHAIPWDQIDVLVDIRDKLYDSDTLIPRILYLQRISTDQFSWLFGISRNARTRPGRVSISRV